MNDPAIAGLILSGGASRRMGTPKALLTTGGQTFVDRLIDIFAAACSPVILVLGHDADRILPGIRRVRQAQLVVNPDPERGMLSSLQCGLRLVSADAVIFTPVDYPTILSSTLSAIARAFAKHHAPVTIPRYEGQRGHPVCISRQVVSELLALPETAQASDITRAYRDVTQFVEVGDPGIVRDIDCPADYRALQEAT
jgi:molybdenum cofactor cytidylyltransferase